MLINVLLFAAGLVLLVWGSEWLVKGAARLVGAVELGEAAARLEAAGRATAWDRVLPAAADVHTALARLRLDVAERWPAA